MNRGRDNLPRSNDRFDTAAYDGASEDKTSPVYREIQHGTAKIIVGIVSSDGTCESHDYIASLTPADQAQFKARFERYAQHGYLRSPKEMRVIVESQVVIRVHEIKTRNGHRLFGVEDGNRFVASHGTRKPKDNAVKQHAKKARSAYLDAKDREAERKQP